MTAALPIAPAVPASMSSAVAPGVLVVMNDIDPALEQAFNQWYEQQHLDERLGVPGFLRARRYLAVDAQPAYMAIYDCASIDVLASCAYRERLANPTDWTRQVMPGFRNMLRVACRESWARGNPGGAAVIVVQCKALPGKEAGARRHIANRLAPALLKSGASRLALWESDLRISKQQTAEQALRGAQDLSANWILFAETNDLDMLAPALHARTLDPAAAHDGLLIGSWSRYRLTTKRLAPASGIG